MLDNHPRHFLLKLPAKSGKDASHDVIPDREHQQLLRPRHQPPDALPDDPRINDPLDPVLPGSDQLPHPITEPEQIPDQLEEVPCLRLPVEHLHAPLQPRQDLVPDRPVLEPSKIATKD